MIKIIKKEVKIVKEYDVEPKTATLYYVDKYRKDIVKIENCIFKEAKPVGWGANDPNKYWLAYENETLFRNVLIDITTGKVKDDSKFFFDYEQAVSIHKKQRIEFLKDRIADLKDEVTRLKEYQQELKEYQQELEELENFKKKGGE